MCVTKLAEEYVRRRILRELEEKGALPPATIARNLSMVWKTANRYLALMEKDGHVEIVRHGWIFIVTATPKGRVWLAEGEGNRDR